MISKIRFWFECARWYSLPMSFFSWLIVFSYALHNGGNLLYGFLALIGICFAHLATNLFDDFCDYHSLKKCYNKDNELTLPNTQRGKCKYILTKKASLKDVLIVSSLFCLFAMIIGIFFIYSVGIKVSIFMIFGGLIVLFYSLFSNMCLSELAVGLAFGPILFGGVYYVMTSHLTPEVFIIALPSTLFTINLLYTDTVLDKEIDKKEGKRTLVSLFKKDENIFKFQSKMLTLAYLSVLLIPIFDIADWPVFCTFLTIPLCIDLIDSLKSYSNDKTSIPKKMWYHFPFEKWEEIEENRSPEFMFRMYQARNLMIYSSILLTIGLCID